MKPDFTSLITAPPVAIAGSFSLVFTIMTFVAILLAASRHEVLLNENQTLYLFSTSAQVIAAIYGLTLTGYSFVRIDLSREERADDTLVQAIDSLKSRYFKIFIFITILVGVTLLLSNLAISYENTTRGWVWDIIVNAGQAGFITSLLAIAYFVLDIIWPDRIKIASKRLQESVDRELDKEKKGSLEDFLRNYNLIEGILEDKSGTYVPVEHMQSVSQNKFYRKISNIRLAEIFLRSEKIDNTLFLKLRDLITLRNSIIHGADPAVSQSMVALSEEVLGDLERTLA